jgi:hypothetical protein
MIDKAMLMNGFSLVNYPGKLADAMSPLGDSSSKGESFEIAAMAWTHRKKSV